MFRVLFCVAISLALASPSVAAEKYNNYPQPRSKVIQTIRRNIDGAVVTLKAARQGGDALAVRRARSTLKKAIASCGYLLTPVDRGIAKTATSPRRRNRAERRNQLLRIDDAHNLGHSIRSAQLEYHGIRPTERAAGFKLWLRNLGDRISF